MQHLKLCAPVEPGEYVITATRDLGNVLRRMNDDPAMQVQRQRVIKMIKDAGAQECQRQEALLGPGNTFPGSICFDALLYALGSVRVTVLPPPTASPDPSLPDRRKAVHLQAVRAVRGGLPTGLPTTHVGESAEAIAKEVKRKCLERKISDQKAAEQRRAECVQISGEPKRRTAEAKSLWASL